MTQVKHKRGGYAEQLVYRSTKAMCACGLRVGGRENTFHSFRVMSSRVLYSYSNTVIRGVYWFIRVVLVHTAALSNVQLNAMRRSSRY
jgi:hypothetical protein